MLDFRLYVCICMHVCIIIYNWLLLFLSAHSGYYSVESSCGNEWVVFNAGQVLPCYVIKVQKCDPRKPQPPPLHSLLVTSDGGNGESVKDKKAALLARVSMCIVLGCYMCSGVMVKAGLQCMLTWIVFLHCAFTIHVYLIPMIDWPEDAAGDYTHAW